MKRSQRGAVIVEAALTLPLFLGFLFAFIDYSSYATQRMAIIDATKTAGRIGAQAGSDIDADWQILQGIKNVNPFIKSNNYKCVLVYKASSLDVTKNSCDDCSTSCNAYHPESGAFSYASTLFKSVPSDTCSIAGAGTTLDKNWPAGCRDDNATTTDVNTCDSSINCLRGTDFVGVYIQYKFDGVSGLFPVPSTIRSNFVIQIEARKAGM